MLAGLFEEAGFVVTSNDYISRQTVNKKEGLCVPRVFVQAKFTKPETNCPESNRDEIAGTINSEKTLLHTNIVDSHCDQTTDTVNNRVESGRRGQKSRKK